MEQAEEGEHAADAKSHAPRALRRAIWITETMMQLPFTRDAFLDVFAAYNERLWPVAVGLWLLTVYAFVGLIRASHRRTAFIPVLLAIHWAWAGLAYHAAFFSRINPAAWVFSALFVIEAMVLTWEGVVCRGLSFSRGHSPRHLMAFGLILYALLYPLIAAAGGHAYPRVPTFGVPCPTTILTVGFLLAADLPYPHAATVIPVLWAFIGGSAAFLLGVRADLMLIAAGVALLGDVIRQRARAARQDGRALDLLHVERGCKRVRED